MADPQDKEPAEGSRETIDKELKRQDRKPDNDKDVELKGPAQPRS